MEKIFKKIAKNNGVSTKSIKKDLSVAIKDAMENSQKNEYAKAFWSELSADGKEPTAEDVILKILSEVNKNIQNKNGFD